MGLMRNVVLSAAEKPSWLVQKMASLVENTLTAIADLGIILSNSGRHAVGTLPISFSLSVCQHHIFSQGDDYSNDDGDIDGNNSATMFMRIMVVRIMTTMYMMLL